MNGVRLRWPFFKAMLFKRCEFRFIDSGTVAMTKRFPTRRAAWRWFTLTNDKAEQFGDNWLVIDEEWLAKYDKTDEGTQRYWKDKTAEWEKKQ